MTFKIDQIREEARIIPQGISLSGGPWTGIFYRNGDDLILLRYSEKQNKFLYEMRLGEVYNTLWSYVPKKKHVTNLLNVLSCNLDEFISASNFTTGCKIKIMGVMV